MPTFCRHNRFFADCPICSKGTVLDPDRQSQRRARTPSAARPGAKRRSTAPAAGAARASRGPFASVGPYDGAEIRLERVPGGLRLAAWRGGQIDRMAPVVAARDVPALIAEATERELLPTTAGSDPLTSAQGSDPLTNAQGSDPLTIAEAGVFGASPGRTGELQDELRVERLDDSKVRIARWIMRPNRGWELQRAPVLLPAKRFTQALAAAAAKGVLASDSPAPARPS